MVSGCDLHISEIALMAMAGGDSVVSRETHCGLESKPGGGRDFPHLSRQALGPTKTFP